MQETQEVTDNQIKRRATSLLKGMTLTLDQINVDKLTKKHTERMDNDIRVVEHALELLYCIRNHIASKEDTTD